MKNSKDFYPTYDRVFDLKSLEPSNDSTFRGISNFSLFVILSSNFSFLFQVRSNRPIESLWLSSGVPTESVARRSGFDRRKRGWKI